MPSRHSMTAFYMGILAAFLNAGHAVAALNMEIIPAAPRYQEPVVARLLRPALDFGVIYGATTSMQGNTITVVYYEYPELSSASHDVSLGQLPAGTYTVQLRRYNGSAIEATAQFTVGGAPVPNPLFSGGPQIPSVNFSGYWWSPGEVGWGVNVAQGPTNLLFATWLVHDTSGNPTWYTLEPGQWTSGETFMTFTGPIYRTTGAFWAAPYVGPPLGTAVGVGTLSFRDSQTGTLNFVVDGVRTIKPLARFPIE